MSHQGSSEGGYVRRTSSSSEVSPAMSVLYVETPRLAMRKAGAMREGPGRAALSPSAADRWTILRVQRSMLSVRESLIFEAKNRREAKGGPSADCQQALMWSSPSHVKPP